MKGFQGFANVEIQGTIALYPRRRNDGGARVRVATPAAGAYAEEIGNHFLHATHYPSGPLADQVMGLGVGTRVKLRGTLGYDSDGYPHVTVTKLRVLPVPVREAT